MDPISGWAEIRPYCSETWKFLRAAFKCPVFLLSATMEESSLERILGYFSYNRSKIEQKYNEGVLEINREDLAVLYKNPDRPNIYTQRRMLKKPVDVM